MARFSIEIQYDGLPKITRSEIRALKQQGLVAAGLTLFGEVLQKKFTTQAARKYHYTKRKTKDIFSGKARKTRKGRSLAPSGLPLVWSGRSRVLGQTAKIKASSVRGKVITPIRVFNFRRGPNTDPALDMLAEYRATTNADAKLMGDSARKDVRSRLKKFKKRVTIKY